MTAGGRVADYDSVAAGYDRRYAIHEYAGVRGTLLGFVGEAGALLEVGCGTGHWLAALASQTPSSSRRRFVAGVEPAAELSARAPRASHHAHLVRPGAAAVP